MECWLLLLKPFVVVLQGGSDCQKFWVRDSEVVRTGAVVGVAMLLQRDCSYSFLVFLSNSVSFFHICLHRFITILFFIFHHSFPRFANKLSVTIATTKSV